MNGTSNSAIQLGRLEVSSRNPRYFTVADGHPDAGRAVYLTGAHVNNNFHDGLGLGSDGITNPVDFDFDDYLRFLGEHGHNFIRLWRWEQFIGYLPHADVHMNMTPQPWLRSGPGLAEDGKPRFDLSRFDSEFFNRLRRRVEAAGRAGMYVSVMFFEGFSLNLTATPDNIKGHPFWFGNNVNGIGITSSVDYQVLPLDPHVQEVQRSYIRQVVDTVQDLPNVLYEVANEAGGMTADQIAFPDGSVIDTPIGDTTTWQYWVIDYVNQYEVDQGYDHHPIGMTFQYPAQDQARANDSLWVSPAEWISPGFDDGPAPMNSRWYLDPPANDATKVVLSDNDHYSPAFVDAIWAWKSMTRGHNPILYDLGIVAGTDPTRRTAGAPPFEDLEPARWALGDTLRYANQLDLLGMEPHGELASSGYVMANPGVEYLIVNPADRGPDLTVRLSPGTYEAQWHGITTRCDHAGTPVSANPEGATTIRSPFLADDDAVLWLRRSQQR